MTGTSQNPSRRADHRNSQTRRRVANACETCKRRKERCDGFSPCGRCRQRRVGDQCFFAENRNERARRGGHAGIHAVQDQSSWDENAQGLSQNHPGRQEYTPVTNEASDNLERQTSHGSPLEHSRLIRDQKGRYMFIGDSANLSFLQIMRRVIGECVGSCSFVDDPLGSLMVEASPEGRPDWLTPTDKHVLPQIILSEAQNLLKRFMFATGSVLDLFDEDELMQHLPAWINGRWNESAIPSSVYCLVLAIGSQTSPEDKDEIAEAFFNHGRYLTAQSFMEDPSMLTVQSYALVSMYLLGACRRNAAFMYLGIAVRAAYAIGLHRKEIASSFPPREFRSRERLWKVLRVLDLFTSASLGRPPSTTETRDTQAEEEYSASLDLCAIFEKVLSDVYSRRMISTAALSNIGGHHRNWASRYFRGLAEDSIDSSDVIEGGQLPNIGQLHLKEAYYWTIILLTRPFFTESVTLHMNRAASNVTDFLEPCTAYDPNNRVLVLACLDSAIRTIELLKVLQAYEALPKRLPFVINSIFIAALVLGFAYFGDLYQRFPLERHLKTAQRLLALFPHDAIANRNANTIAFLQEACDAYYEKRTTQRMEQQNLAIGNMFGQIHRLRSSAPTRAQSPSRNSNAGTAPETQVVGAQGDAARNAIGAAAATASEQDQSALNNVSNYPNVVDSVDDFMNLPYPTMTPRTLWFDDDMSLFSTISSTNDYFSSLPT